MTDNKVKKTEKNMRGTAPVREEAKWKKRMGAGLVTMLGTGVVSPLEGANWITPPDERMSGAGLPAAMPLKSQNDESLKNTALREPEQDGDSGLSKGTEMKDDARMKTPAAGGTREPGPETRPGPRIYGMPTVEEDQPGLKGKSDGAGKGGDRNPMTGGLPEKEPEAAVLPKKTAETAGIPTA